MHGLLFLYFCQSCEVCKQLFGADFIKRDFEQRIVRHRRGGNDETRAERLVQDSIAYAVCTGRRGLYARLEQGSPALTFQRIDLDALVVGPAVRQGEAIFDEFWNSPAVIHK